MDRIKNMGNNNLEEIIQDDGGGNDKDLQLEDIPDGRKHLEAKNNPSL